MSKEIFYFIYDEDGYYTGVNAVSDGSVPENSTTVDPNYQIENWYKINDAKDAWTAEKIPQTVEDCIGVTYPYEERQTSTGTEHKSILTQHQLLLRSIVERILDDTDDARVEVKDGICTVVAIDEATKLQDAKDAKIEELTNVAHKFDNDLVCEEMIITSSLGFLANADIRSQNNVRGLLNILTDDASTAYADADNNYHMLTKANLETLLTEIITNGNNLYTQKWTYRALIEKCTSIEEVSKIEFVFTMMDFSKTN